MGIHMGIRIGIDFAIGTEIQTGERAAYAAARFISARPSRRCGGE
jgi:hypothetical protein